MHRPGISPRAPFVVCVLPQFTVFEQARRRLIASRSVLGKAGAEMTLLDAFVLGADTPHHTHTSCPALPCTSLSRGWMLGGEAIRIQRTRNLPCPAAVLFRRRREQGVCDDSHLPSDPGKSASPGANPALRNENSAQQAHCLLALPP